MLWIINFQQYKHKNAKKGKIIRKKEGIAAEKIYWKDATTIAVILYKEVQQITTIPEQITDNEILIKL